MTSDTERSLFFSFMSIRLYISNLPQTLTIGAGCRQNIGGRIRFKSVLDRETGSRTSASER